MRPAWWIAGAIGGLVGATATGAAIVTAAKNQAGHQSTLDPSTVGAEPFGRFEPGSASPGSASLGRESTVAADDGVPLSVEEVDPADGGNPDVTVLLVHGYGLDRRCWHFQRRDLALSTAPRVRQVLFDLRCHGRSGQTVSGSTIEQLGADLDAVIRAVSPEGPLVVIGHSMGGMTIMELAATRPTLFAQRIHGVALLNTAAGEIGRSGLGRAVLSRRNPLTAAAGTVAGWQPGAVEQLRRFGGRPWWRVVRSYAFGDAGVNPALVDLMVEMIDGTPVSVLTNFLSTLEAHDRYAALAALRQCEVTVIGGDADRLTPHQHSEAIAALLPDAELVRVVGAGHMTMLEQPEAVNAALLRLLERSGARSSRPRRRA